jgi:tetrahydromethanopterin S-methyltransferase subunit F
MGKIAVVGSSATKDSQTLVFSGAMVEEIADKAALFLAARGYTLESGVKTQGVYGRGSAAGRVLLGALSKRMKYNVTVGKDGENVALVIAKGMSGISGGLWGMSQEKKELQAIVTGLQGAILS